MSVRHKTDGQFWYTFFHQAEHPLEGLDRHDFIDGADSFSPIADDVDEAAANRLARGALLSPSD